MSRVARGDSSALFALWLAATAVGCLGLLPLWQWASVSSGTSNAVLLSIFVLPPVLGVVVATYLNISCSGGRINSRALPSPRS